MATKIAAMTLLWHPLNSRPLRLFLGGAGLSQWQCGQYIAVPAKTLEKMRET
ncbi:hypothetical protein FC24_GL001818 [Loigolactobacillus rennini DSM 20253]|uniref:Uncharacterized protein n=1 Tax=Loigolactobacillus rennini DSM 20253 TaxID=1423796 RepID=A0A0R2D532_9LACO|nr:hypothetical protein FC24_GL001818 [Loigolactobacillus rennini DSM 20253]